MTYYFNRKPFKSIGEAIMYQVEETLSTPLSVEKYISYDIEELTKDKQLEIVLIHLKFKNKHSDYR